MMFFGLSVCDGFDVVFLFSVIICVLIVVVICFCDVFVFGMFVVMYVFK